jgi:nucleoside 2-deoxyribosyltransferase
MKEFDTKIYLASTIYTECISDAKWKDTFMNRLFPDMYTIYDPDPKNGSGEEVVGIDKKIIESCDFLVAYIKKPSFGTAMEIKHAFDRQNITVFLIDPEGVNLENPWLTYHSHRMFTSIQSCADMINELTCKMKVYNR